jgi:hypothetical protein
LAAELIAKKIEDEMDRHVITALSYGGEELR